MKFQETLILSPHIYSKILRLKSVHILSFFIMLFGTCFINVSCNNEGSSEELSSVPTAEITLANFIRENTDVLESRISTHNGNFYQLHVLVPTSASFTPLAIQLVRTEHQKQPTVIALGAQSNLNCLRISAFDVEGTDPYRSYLSGDKRAYETATIEPFKLSQRYVNIVVDTISGRFLVERIEVKGKCTWLVD